MNHLERIAPSPKQTLNGGREESYLLPEMETTTPEHRQGHWLVLYDGKPAIAHRSANPLRWSLHGSYCITDRALKEKPRGFLEPVAYLDPKQILDFLTGNFLKTGEGNE